MIRITNEINGKKYELVPETEICKGCCFDTDYRNTHSIDCAIEEDGFNGTCVCHTLRGIWKEVKDENLG